MAEIERRRSLFGSGSDPIKASLTPTSGITYSTDLSPITDGDLKLYSYAISNNADITNETTAVYIDDTIANKHYRLAFSGYPTSSKTMNIDGEDYIFDILGFNHDILSDINYYGNATSTGKAGITWWTRQCLKTKYAMNLSATTVGGWTQSNMKTTIIPTLLTNFNFKNAVAPVLKYTSAGNNSTTITSDVNSLFLLSEVEVFGTNTYSAVGEGERYRHCIEYHATIKKVISSGNYIAWGLRSPAVGSSLRKNNFCSANYDEVTEDGIVNNSGSANTEGYIAIAFCS